MYPFMVTVENTLKAGVQEGILGWVGSNFFRVFSIIIPLEKNN